MRTVYLSDTDPEFSTVADEIAALLRAGSCVPILGAGISLPAPSCMPLGKHLEGDLRNALWASVSEFERQCPMPAAARNSAQQIIGVARLERMLDVLQQTHGPAPVRQFLSVFRGAAWNKNHDSIAILATAGYLPHCITLNFDLLIEQAVSARGGVAQTVCPLRDGAGFFTPSNSANPSICIIKPHGSLAPAEHPDGEFDLLTTTLSEVGSKPDERNLMRLNTVLGEGRCLLSAGYSDHDWDIFPILNVVARSLCHIYWVAYLKPAEVDRRTVPCGEGFDRVHKWLAAHGVRSTLLLGDPGVLLDCAIARLPLTPSAMKSDRCANVRQAPTTQFLIGPDEVLATSVSFALLLQDRGQFHEHLVRWLLDREGLQRHPLLASQLHRTAAHSCHTRRDLREALSHMGHCVRLKKRAVTDSTGSVSTADELIWAGYEHLCLIKRPGWRWLLILPAVWNWYRGVHLMNRGIRGVHSLSSRKRRKLRAMVRFYRGDLLQSWAGLLLFVGGALGPASRWLYRRAAVWYERAHRIDPASMGWEYYWLRTLEAQLLGGTPNLDLDATLQRIEELDWSYDILQNHVQRGNTLAYRALFEGIAGRGNLLLLLDKAETIWSADDGFVPSGLMRVILFRRALRLTSRTEAIREIRKLSRTICLRQRAERATGNG